jgi:hypothetical protein
MRDKIKKEKKKNIFFLFRIYVFRRFLRRSFCADFQQKLQFNSGRSLNQIFFFFPFSLCTKLTGPMGNPFNAKRTRLSQYNKKAHAVSNLCRGVIPFSRFIEVNSSHFFPQQKITNLKKRITGYFFHRSARASSRQPSC